MDPQPQLAVDNWLSSWAIQELATSELAQIDIDELFNEPPEFAVRVGLECLQLALAQAHQTDTDLEGLLTIPLAWSEALDTALPSLSSIFAERWTYGPGLEVVGLYLVRPRVWRHYEAGEQYRHNLVGGDLPPGYVAYYQCSRTDTDASSGSEYARTIYIRSTTT